MTSLNDKIDKGEQDEDDKVFEITDFTTASPWERLISDIEKLFRQWGLAESTVADFKKPCQYKVAELTMRGYKYCLELHPPCDKHSQNPLMKVVENVGDTGVTQDVLRRFKQGGLDDTEVPPVMLEMMSTSDDFNLFAHDIQRWYGISNFVLLTSVGSSYSSKISESEARLLISALRTAAANSNCLVPVFSQVDDLSKDLFLGYAGCDGLTTWFETVSLGSVPDAYFHLSGLLDLFKSKLNLPRHSMQISISAQFTFKIYNYFDDWLNPSQDDEDDHIRKKHTYRDHPLHALPVGQTNDPIKWLSLATSWPQFREDAVLDNEHYTELNPCNAPTWILRSMCHDHEGFQVQGKLGNLVEKFASFMQSNFTWKDLLGGDGFDATETPGSAKEALNKFGGGRSFVGRRLGGTLSSTLSTLEKTMVKARASVKRVGNFVPSGKLPSEEDLNNMWWYLFVHKEKRKSNPRGHEYKMPEDGTESCRIKHCRGVPDGDFLGLFSVYAALTGEHNGGIFGIALLWSEFVKEIRDCWNDLDIPPDLHCDKSPDMRCCLVSQKIQMIGCCIKQQSERNAIKSGNNPTSEENSEKSRSSKAVDDNSDQEFMSAEEDNSGEELEQAQSPNTTPLPKNNDPVGVKEASNMRLLNSGATLNIPITQDDAPMTEDMLEERQDLLTDMGATDDASRTRTEMQTLSLRSDMMAFKAANPGCILEDFVRWHSPRDWIVSDDCKDGKLSERFAHEDNIWITTWKDTSPTPVSKQRALFDAAKEAEKALQYLETLEPAKLVWQLTGPLLEHCVMVLRNTAHEKLYLSGGRENKIHTALHDLKKECASFGNDFQSDIERIKSIVTRIHRVESLISQADALMHKFEKLNEKHQGEERLSHEKQVLLATCLLDDDPHLVLEADERDAMKWFFAQELSVERMAEAEPDTREFLFRVVSARPRQSSRPSAHRMYCSLSESNFRISGAVSTDDLFI
eukprot:m.93265 g.93265  ORF g.93265 m.93265 type:complete len:970 (+) comp13396_c0_seq2:149-3058(+)